jgi:hypothetical protein
MNSAINIPNGCGKSTIMKTILAMLVGQRSMLKELRTTHYAPRSTGLYSHARIQVKINMEGPVNDLVSRGGGDLPGEPMVFGLYGNAGENEDVHLYSYKGTFEDCPIGRYQGNSKVLVRDDVFLKQLSVCTRLFPSPSNKSEGTIGEWRRYISDIFDMPSLIQQLNYQAANGGEGGASYFEVTDERGANFLTKNYSAKVFYKVLAPELLVNVMGDQGETDEVAIEHTILNKVSQLLSVKRKSDAIKHTLQKTENTLIKLGESLEYGQKLSDAKSKYTGLASDYVTEMAAIKSVVEQNPIPGIPKLPPETISPLAKMMVLQNGEWFIPDSVMAEFTNEPVSAVNRRAIDRKRIELIQLQKSQLIDFTCHSYFSEKKRGPSGQLYNRESAIAVLEITTNFTNEWSQSKAIDVVHECFDWLENYGDTNPARILLSKKEQELKEKVATQSDLSSKVQSHSQEKIELLGKQQKISQAQAEYRKIQDSNHFTTNELENLIETGQAVNLQCEAAHHELTTHRTKVASLKRDYEGYNKFIGQYGKDTQPKQVASALRAQVSKSQSDKEHNADSIEQERKKRPDIENASKQANSDYIKSKSDHEEYIKLKPLVVLFDQIFGDVSPDGLEQQVVADIRSARKDKLDKSSELSELKPMMEHLKSFRQNHPDTDPAKWLENRLTRWNEIEREINTQRQALLDKKAKRESLNKDFVAPSKVAREAMFIAGNNAEPVHAAISRMDLNLAQKTKALTLFSSLLHSPVFETVEAAAKVAKIFFEKDIESPVFVFDELRDFFTSDLIKVHDLVANTWLVGVRTRPVDCLLNPSLVEQEKALLDQDIADLEKTIALKEQEKKQYNPNAGEATVAQFAVDAIKRDVETKFNVSMASLSEIEIKLIDLEKRASSQALEAIRAKISHLAKFANLDEECLLEKVNLLSERSSQLLAMLNELDNRVEALEGKQRELDAIWSGAVDKSRAIDRLEEIQSFIDEATNLELMNNAEQIEKKLSEKQLVLDKKSRFEFDLAAQALTGSEQSKTIEDRLTHLSGEIQHIQDKLLPSTNQAIEDLRKVNDDLLKNTYAIDGFIRGLIVKYKEFMRELNSDGFVHEVSSTILPHPLSDSGAELLEITDIEEQLKQLLVMASDEYEMDNQSLRQEMKDAKTNYDSASKLYSLYIDSILGGKDLDLPEHAKISLRESKDEPSKLRRVYEVTSINFEKNKAANEQAQQHIQSEWDGIGEWLATFTRQIEDNLKALKSAFSPVRAGDTHKILKAGFDIEATLASIDDIENTLNEVVELIRQHESVEHSIQENFKSETKAEKKRRKDSLLTKVRDTFYQKIILNPSIKMCMPSISHKPIELQKKMVSTGQGVAMTLLWLVKMSAYITDREILSYGTERAKLRRARATKTQFTIIDGAFSSLSDEDLIKDALEGVSDKYGAFQLIITVHDRDYKNNYTYFPTLIEARSIDGRLMYVVNKDEIASNAYKGSTQELGTMATLNITKMPKEMYQGVAN